MFYIEKKKKSNDAQVEYQFIHRFSQLLKQWQMER